MGIGRSATEIVMSVLARTGGLLFPWSVLILNTNTLRPMSKPSEKFCQDWRTSDSLHFGAEIMNVAAHAKSGDLIGILQVGKIC